MRSVIQNSILWIWCRLMAINYSARDKITQHFWVGGQMPYTFLYLPPKKTVLYICIHPSFLSSFIRSIWSMCLQNYYIYYQFLYAFKFNLFPALVLNFYSGGLEMIYAIYTWLYYRTSQCNYLKLFAEKIFGTFLIGYNQKFKYFSPFCKHCCLLPNTNIYMDCLQLII